MQHFDQWLLLVAVEIDVASFQSNACDTMWCFLKRLSILMGLKSKKKKRMLFSCLASWHHAKEKRQKSMAKVVFGQFGKRNSQKQRQTILECVV